MTRKQQIDILKRLLAEKPNNTKRDIWTIQLKNLEKKTDKPRQMKARPRVRRIRNRSRRILTEETPVPTPMFAKPEPSGIGGVDQHIVPPKAVSMLETISAMDRPKDIIRKEYLKLALYPETASIMYGGMPDELTQPSNTYRSVREFDLKVNADGTDNSGRFSFAVQPIFGSHSSPEEFQTGIVDTTNGWPTNFGALGSYETSNANADPRVDPNAEFFTTGSCGQYYDPRVTSNYTFYQNGDYDGALFQPTGSPQINTLGVVAGTSPLTLTFETSGLFTLTNAYPLNVPVGVFDLHPVLINIGTFGAVILPGQSLSIGFLMLSINKSGVVDGIFRSTPTSTDVISGYFVNNLHRLTDWAGRVYNVEQSLWLEDNFNIYSDGEHSFAFGVSSANITPPLSSSSISAGVMLTATCDRALAAVSNAGLIVKMRPIALSVLVTCTLPDISAGGNIVALSAPSGDIKSCYYQTSSSRGAYQMWEELAKTNKGNMLYDGNLKQGCYVWTQPWDKNDTLMRTPMECNEYAYQGVVVSGQLSKAADLSGIVNLGRIRIVIIYEYLTDSRIFNPIIHPGSTADLDFVLGYLGVLDHAMENNNHLKKLSDFISKGARFMKDSIPTMIKGLNTAGAIAGLLI